MQQIIAAYLFQHKSCPLPGLGTLSIQQGSAQSDFLNKTMLPPSPVIVFDSKETEADVLLDHIAAKTNSSIYQAIETLGQFANQLKSDINSGNPAILNGVGIFSQGSSGSMHFEPTAVSEIFVQPVEAIRVIHPQAEHSILVGDKETTNTEMTEYFSEETVQKSYWWIWAVALGIAGILAIIMYLNSGGNVSSFGNATSIQ
jgi:hypothetical protein